MRHCILVTGTAKQAGGGVGSPMNLGVGTDGFTGHYRFALTCASPLDCSTTHTLQDEPLTVQ